MGARLLTCLYNGSPWDGVSPLKIQSSQSESCRTGKAPRSSCSQRCRACCCSLRWLAQHGRGEMWHWGNWSKSQHLERNRHCPGGTGIKFREKQPHFPILPHEEARAVTCSEHQGAVTRVRIVKGSCPSHFFVLQGETSPSLLKHSLQLQKRDDVSTRFVTKTSESVLRWDGEHSHLRNNYLCYFEKR